MKIKTCELTGAALDWAVAKCIANVHDGEMLNGTVMCGWWISGLFTDLNHWIRDDEFKPSTNWSVAGPIIEREEIWLKSNAPCSQGRQWDASLRPFAKGTGESWCYGATPLVAAMRCLVQAKLGLEVEIPDELL